MQRSLEEEENLIEGLQNVAIRRNRFNRFAGAIATCSSGSSVTISSVLLKPLRKELAGKLGRRKTEKIKIVPINTPSFVETHLKGYDNAVKALMNHIAEPSRAE